MVGGPESLAASKPGMRSLLLFLLALSSLTVWADVIEGRVVGVADGDTITLLDGNRQQHRIRLAGIDAPELSHSASARSSTYPSWRSERMRKLTAIRLIATTGTYALSTSAGRMSGLLSSMPA